MASALTQISNKVFGSKNDRELKRLRPVVSRINELEAEFEHKDRESLCALIAEWKERLGAIEDHDDREDATWELLPDVFAAVREAAKRTLGQRHFDVQLIGGMVLHQRKIAEMKTGEGKTLVATLPAVLNALAGRGVHVVTVNDYLARRDAEWMSPLYKALGLTVGVIVHDLDDDQRRAAYVADITYGTNNEFGFDYLRDNMKYDLAQCVQRGHHFSIVHEADSILIYEAPSPQMID